MGMNHVHVFYMNGVNINFPVIQDDVMDMKFLYGFEHKF